MEKTPEVLATEALERSVKELAISIGRLEFYIRDISRALMAMAEKEK